MSDTLNYILSRCPQSFRGKESWLGVKMSPHSHWEFINEITTEGVTTNSRQLIWDECPKEILCTIYQRLKLNETLLK